MTYRDSRGRFITREDWEDAFHYVYGEVPRRGGPSAPLAREEIRELHHEFADLLEEEEEEEEEDFTEEEYDILSDWQGEESDWDDDVGPDDEFELSVEYEGEKK